MDRDESFPSPDEQARRQAESRWLSQIAARGDDAQRALRHLLDAYSRKFMTFFIRRGLSRDEAEDLLQDVFTAIFSKAADFKVGATPSSWIWAIARNRWVDAMRDPYRTRREVTDGEDDLAEIADREAASSDANAPQAADECVRRGMQAFERHWPEEAMVLQVRALEGWPMEQVAEYLGRTMGATRTYLSEVRKKSRPFFEPCLELLSA